ncbi:MAG TPA: DUF167 domain-containing protein [Gemmatimonadales bacterium]|nr:DUF167 domain-containing protein [Gemmatimonadales bacterium]
MAPEVAADAAIRGLTATIVLHVVPRARVTGVAGRHGDALKIRVAAPPMDGAANAELIRFLAERLSVPRSAVTITAGHTSRRKTVRIAGIETAAALRTLEAT